MLSQKKFQRRKEDFVCEVCGTIVKGNGYTDHCPNCLWGRHVDVNPGDRAADCSGMMKPVRAEIKHGNYIIEFKCKKCPHSFYVKAAKDDNMCEIIKLINK